MLDPEIASGILKSTAEVLEDMGVKYFIDSGTLLSAYRDKGINIYDHDIDVRILPSQLSEDRMPELVSRLWGIGYRVIIHNRGTRAQLICVHKDRVMLDLKFCFQDKHLLWMYCWQSATGEEEPRVHCYPRKFFRHMGEIELLGKKYPTPSQIEEYIEQHYGKDWKEFKDKIEKAEETDLTWDYMKDPPCSMSVEELIQKRKELKGR